MLEKRKKEAQKRKDEKRRKILTGAWAIPSMSEGELKGKLDGFLKREMSAPYSVLRHSQWVGEDAPPVRDEELSRRESTVEVCFVTVDDMPISPLPFLLTRPRERDLQWDQKNCRPWARLNDAG